MASNIHFDVVVMVFFKSNWRSKDVWCEDILDPPYLGSA